MKNCSKNCSKNRERKTVKAAKGKGRARLPYGGGYEGLALAICNGNRTLASKAFGIKAA